MRVAHLTLVQVLLAISTAQRFNSLPGCPKVKLENGSIRWRKGLPGSPNLGIFKCSSFFHLLGEKKLYCMNGGLSGPLPVCIAPGCDSSGKTNVENGQVKIELQGSKLSVICFEDFETHQFPVIVCNQIAYNASLPQCYPKNPALECNLDNGLCGWTQDTFDPNDWDQQRSATTYRDQGFGPNKDHSADGKGQYLYLDGGITEDSPNASLARLYSPVYAAKYSSGATCFSFWYHIFGDEEFGTLGTLLVQQLLVGEDSKLTASTQLAFEIQGDQGDAWRKGVLALQSTNQSFRILVQAVSGNSNISVIAIDDFKISSDCEDIPKNSTLILSCKYRCGSNANPLSENYGCSCLSSCHYLDRCCADCKKYCQSEESEGAVTGKSHSPEIAEGTKVPFHNKTTSTPNTTPSTTSTTTTTTSTTTTTTTTTPAPTTPTKTSTKTTYRTTIGTSSTAFRTKTSSRQLIPRTTPKIYPWTNKTTVSTIRPTKTTRTASKTTLVPATTTTHIVITTTEAKYREDINVEFQPHSFESPLGSVLGAIVGIAFLLVVSSVVIGIWVKQQKQKRLYAKDDHEVAFLTQNAEDEPILDFSLASPSSE